MYFRSLWVAGCAWECAGLCLKCQSAAGLGEHSAGCGHGWLLTDVRHGAGWRLAIPQVVSCFTLLISPPMSAPPLSSWEVWTSWSAQNLVVSLGSCSVPSSSACCNPECLFYLMNVLLAGSLLHADEITKEMRWVGVTLCSEDCCERRWSLLLLMGPHLRKSKIKMESDFTIAASWLFSLTVLCSSVDVCRGNCR